MKKDPAHLRNIIALAYADDTLKHKEEAFIAALGKKMGYDEKEIDAIVHAGPSRQVEVPEKQTDRVRYLKHFIGLIMADGEIESKEERMCRSFAEAMGFDPDIVSTYITRTREYLRSGSSSNTILGEINNLFRSGK